jgi:GT2 family glycosyltransferase
VRDLSVVVPTWNTREITLGCLAHLEGEVGPGGSAGLDAEVWLVDNGSDDGTAAAVRERYPWVKRIELSRNLGFAAGVNTGLRRIEGRHALLLNSDAHVLPGALRRCVEYLDRHPDVGVVGPRLLHPNGSSQRSVHRLPRLASEVLPAALLERILPSRFPSEHGGAVVQDVEALRGAALFVRAAVLREVGLLPEQYFLFLEETEWCRRIGIAGWRIVHLPEARVIHLLGASSKRKHPALTRIEYHRSLYRYHRESRSALSGAAVLGLCLAKSLFYVSSQAPLALTGGPRRARWRVHRDVLAWHLRGCPAAVGLCALEGEGLG